MWICDRHFPVGSCFWSPENRCVIDLPQQRREGIEKDPYCTWGASEPVELFRHYSRKVRGILRLGTLLREKGTRKGFFEEVSEAYKLMGIEDTRYLISTLGELRDSILVKQWKKGRRGGIEKDRLEISRLINYKSGDPIPADGIMMMRRQLARIVDHYFNLAGGPRFVFVRGGYQYEEEEMQYKPPSLLVNPGLGFFRSLWFQIAQGITHSHGPYKCRNCKEFFFVKGRKRAEGRNHFCRKEECQKWGRSRAYDEDRRKGLSL